MEFFEFLTVVLVVLGLPMVFFTGLKSVIEARAKARVAAPQTTGSGELRASELRTMIATAVQEAVAPLEDRLADLEGEEAASEARLSPDVLAEAFEEDLDAELAEAIRDRARA